MMRTIIVCYAQNSEDDPDKIIWETNKKSVFFKEEGKIFFQEKAMPEQIIIKEKVLIFDELLAEELILILDEAKKTANQITANILIGKEKEPGGAYLAILTTIQKRITKNPQSIFANLSRNIFEIIDWT